jgi:hypothetical protein
MKAQLFFFTSLLLASGAAFAQSPCDPHAFTGQPCKCDARVLHPLQGALGMEEVGEKTSNINKDYDGEWKDLEDDPIQVIVGPGDRLFITDHHHKADAWLRAGRPDVLCQIKRRPAFGSEQKFWAGLVKDNLVRLADENGKPLAPAQLPSTLDQMPDDPYRSLAWRLRKEKGYCRPKDHKEFVEFRWADWMRNRPELPRQDVSASTEAVLPEALKLAAGPEAKALPGYKPKGSKCPKG